MLVGCSTGVLGGFSVLISIDNYSGFCLYKAVFDIHLLVLEQNG